MKGYEQTSQKKRREKRLLFLLPLKKRKRGKGLKPKYISYPTIQSTQYIKKNMFQDR